MKNNNSVTLSQIRRAVKAEIAKAFSERRRIHRRRRPRTMTPEQEAKFAARRAKRREWWKQREKRDRAQQKAFRALMRAATTYLELIANAPEPARSRIRFNPR